MKLFNWLKCEKLYNGLPKNGQIAKCTLTQFKIFLIFRNYYCWYYKKNKSIM